MQEFNIQSGISYKEQESKTPLIRQFDGMEQGARGTEQGRIQGSIPSPENSHRRSLRMFYLIWIDYIALKHCFNHWMSEHPINQAEIRSIRLEVSELFQFNIQSEISNKEQESKPTLSSHFTFLIPCSLFLILPKIWISFFCLNACSDDASLPVFADIFQFMDIKNADFAPVNGYHLFIDKSGKGTDGIGSIHV